ncbi:hypothetical protein MLD38_032614 [Melastoma candidum]|uniref:Uncharacterized protein n=1 Tax=Melastoma candidum TaxID=119954 RepID=A0ACB9M665_9MYRT|nr:hypothetical protein MLD38_032614 [Melastoma candidum]
MQGKAATAATTSSWTIRGVGATYHSLVSLLIAAMFIAIISLTTHRTAEQQEQLQLRGAVTGQLAPEPSQFQQSVPLEQEESLQLEEKLTEPSSMQQEQTYTDTEDPVSLSTSSSASECDLSSGTWVFDNITYPLYLEKECKYILDEFSCEKFGRKNFTYRNWRWQPHACDLPRFNATRLLELLRNKRLVYVGDSLNRGQWNSMVCLVQSVIPDPFQSLSYPYNGSLIVFKASEYNATVEFYWAPMLVESNSDNPRLHRLPERVIRVKAIEKHATRWTDADFLVFDSYLWWRTTPLITVLWGSFESEDGIYKDMESLRAYKMALSTWSDWLEVHVNRSKTRLFFASLSPTHQKAEDWGGVRGNNCYEETEPISCAIQGYRGSGTDPRMTRLVEEAIVNLGSRGLAVEILNVTQLSEYRKDGHPSIHKRQWRPLTEEQKADPTKYADCFHWCIPGVPDVWNELLYARLLQITPPQS